MPVSLFTGGIELKDPNTLIWRFQQEFTGNSRI